MPEVFCIVSIYVRREACIDNRTYAISYLFLLFWAHLSAHIYNGSLLALIQEDFSLARLHED